MGNIGDGRGRGSCVTASVWLRRGNCAMSVCLNEFCLAVVPCGRFLFKISLLRRQVSTCQDAADTRRASPQTGHEVMSTSSLSWILGTICMWTATLLRNILSFPSLHPLWRNAACPDSFSTAPGDHAVRATCIRIATLSAAKLASEISSHVLSISLASAHLSPCEKMSRHPQGDGSY